MKKIFFFSFSYFILSFAVTACDNCGCFMGVTPYDNQSSIGIFYRYRSYSGYRVAGQSPEFFPDGRIAGLQTVQHNPNGNSGGASEIFSKTDYEVYSVFELRAKYFIHNRAELNLILPYNNNNIRYENDVINLKSIGDVSLLAGYHLIREIETEKKIQQRMILGAGIKLPVGKHDFRNGDNMRYNLLLQPGTGSTDYLFYLNYVVAGSKLGLGLTNVLKVCNENDYSEKFTNSINTSLILFYKYYKGSWQVIPSVQLYYEYLKGLKQKDLLLANTGSNIAMLGPGVDIYFKNFAFTFAIQFPVRDKTDSENLSAAGKMMAGIKYNFNQKKYLFEKKGK